MSVKNLAIINDVLNKVVLAAAVTTVVSTFPALYQPKRAEKATVQVSVPKRELRFVPKSEVAENIALVSTWKTNCGIAIYTEYLVDAMKNVNPNRVIEVYPVGEYLPEEASVLHFQHEFGIEELFGFSVSHFNMVKAKRKVVTFHTVDLSRVEQHRKWCESADALIVHTEYQKRVLSTITGMPIHEIPHGSVIFTPIDKCEARSRLGLPKDKFVLYVHGFQKQLKDYMDIVEAVAEVDGVHLCMLVSQHFSLMFEPEKRKEIDALNSLIGELNVADRVTLVTRFLTEDEVNLYVSAADAILFNYSQPEGVASCSGAMHRVLAGGKPIICTRQDSRLDELVENMHALKYNYGDVAEMKDCIMRLREDGKLAFKLGANCRKLAFETSWANVAVKHLSLYDSLLA